MRNQYTVAVPWSINRTTEKFNANLSKSGYYLHHNGIKMPITLTETLLLDLILTAPNGLYADDIEIKLSKIKRITIQQTVSILKAKMRNHFGEDLLKGHPQWIRDISLRPKHKITKLTYKRPHELKHK